MLDLAQYQIAGSTAREIAATAEAAIREGSLGSGEPLPTVRALAAHLNTSPATVSAAYKTLARRGLVVAEGRRGTRVAPRPAVHASPPAAPMSRLRVPPGARDLAAGLPDPELLPAVGPVLARIGAASGLTMNRIEENDPELVELAARWFARDGIPAGPIAIVNGAFDGIERVLRAHLSPGDRVILEDPAYSAIRDLLLALGLAAVPLRVDERGPVPAELERALAQDPQAAVIVPRAQNPLGSALDEERAAELRSLLAARPDLLLIEDDHAGPVCDAPCVTLIEPERERWACVRSVSKFLHPDLRLAALAGDDVTVARVEGRQALGPRYVSHVLQSTVAELLADPELPEINARAAATYTQRRVALLDALVAHGIRGHGRSGLNVWVPVREEAPVARALLEAGYLVNAGERFRIATPPALRITITRLRPGDAEEVAAVIAGVEGSSWRRRSY